MIKVSIQNQTKVKNIPKSASFKRWVNAALIPENVTGIVTIRIVTTEESQQLNLLYRQKDKPTNVLAFPYNDNELIGDLIICAEIVAAEAAEQEKSLEAHWAHLVVHGCLHCMGYDHIAAGDRIEMETKEVLLLAELGHPNPYEEEIKLHE